MNYKTYRFGNGSALEAMIEKATTHFQREHGQPRVLVVHKTLVEQAVKATAALGLEVKGCGGCMACEVWLSTGNK